MFGSVAAIVSVIAWFAVLFTGKFPRGLWDLCHMYMRWRARAIAYMALLRDEYPPFGDAAYPVEFKLDYPDVRNRLTVAFRLILAIPQLVVFFFVAGGRQAPPVCVKFTTIVASSRLSCGGTCSLGHHACSRNSASGIARRTALHHVVIVPARKV